MLVALPCLRKTREFGSGLARARIGGPQSVAGDAVGGHEFSATQVRRSNSPTMNPTP